MAASRPDAVEPSPLFRSCPYQAMKPSGPGLQTLRASGDETLSSTKAFSGGHFAA